MSRRLAFVLLVALLSAASIGAALAASDPLSPQQWPLQKIQAEQAWATSTGNGVVVAVVDTGVNFAHPELAGTSAGSFSCIGSCVEGGIDDNGHGTLVAGVIAAAANNGKGVASVAPGARIMSVKVLTANGSGELSDVARGISWAADHGAKVINLSLGTDLPLPIVFNLLGGFGILPDKFHSAINHATKAGAVVVAAAGNSGLASSYTGASNLLVVGATGPNDEIASYSSSLAGVDVHAPGGNATGECTPHDCVLTTDRGGGYRAVQGTSFAAPHVSGVVALLMSLGHSNSAAVSRIYDSADRISSGARRVNAARAVGGAGAGTGSVAAPDPGLPGLPLPNLNSRLAGAERSRKPASMENGASVPETELSTEASVPIAKMGSRSENRLTNQLPQAALRRAAGPTPVNRSASAAATVPRSRQHGDSQVIALALAGAVLAGAAFARSKRRAS